MLCSNLHSLSGARSKPHKHSISGVITTEAYLVQETSLAPPCSNLRSFGSKCAVMKKVLATLLGLFGTPQWFGTQGIVPPLSSSLRLCLCLEAVWSNTHWTYYLTSQGWLLWACYRSVQASRLKLVAYIPVEHGKDSSVVIICSENQPKMNDEMIIRSISSATHKTKTVETTRRM